MILLDSGVSKTFFYRVEENYFPPVEPVAYSEAERVKKVAKYIIDKNQQYPHIFTDEFFWEDYILSPPKYATDSRGENNFASSHTDL